MDIERYHDTRFSYDDKRDRAWQGICRYMQERYIGAQDRVLELGAGYCHFINHIRAGRKYALDLFEGLPRFAAPDVTSYVQSCQSIPLEEGSLDVVFASNLFEHITREELQATLKEVRRVLRSGGKLIAIQPNFTYCYRHYFDDYTHIQIFTHAGLADLLESHGFSVERVAPRFLPFSVKTRLPVHPTIVYWYMRLPFKLFAGQMLHVAYKR